VVILDERFPPAIRSSGDGGGGNSTLMGIPSYWQFPGVGGSMVAVLVPGETYEAKGQRKADPVRNRWNTQISAGNTVPEGVIPKDN
jgi:hypothetical protein